MKCFSICRSFFTQHGIGVDFMRDLVFGVSEKYIQDLDPIFGSWERGEEFAQTLLTHLKHDTNESERISCNILLDHEGGDAPMIANTTSNIHTYTYILRIHILTKRIPWSDHLEVYKQPLFYTMGHFTKFIAGGSVRIAAENKNNNVNVVAFLRADKSVAVIILNRYSYINNNFEQLNLLYFSFLTLVIPLVLMLAYKTPIAELFYSKSLHSRFTLSYIFKYIPHF